MTIYIMNGWNYEGFVYIIARTIRVNVIMARL